MLSWYRSTLANYSNQTKETDRKILLSLSFAIVARSQQHNNRRSPQSDTLDKASKKIATPRGKQKPAQILFLRVWTKKDHTVECRVVVPVNMFQDFQIQKVNIIYAVD